MTEENSTAPMLGRRIAIERPAPRLERLRSAMADVGVDVAIVAGSENVTHMCGYWRYYGGPSALVIDSDGAGSLVVMADEEPIAREQAAVAAVVGYGDLGFGFELQPLPGLVAALAEVPAVRDAGRLGLADGLGGLGPLLRPAVRAEVADIAPALAAIRMVRDEDELVRILHAYELCWRAQAAVGEMAGPGVSEIELFTTAASTAQLGHGSPIEFLADLLSGPMTSRVCAPVHVAGRRRLEPGDSVVADIVVGAGGYWGDTAETHVASGDTEVAELRAGLLEILRACAAELRPGVTGAEIFASMRDRVSKAFPRGELRHHGGHGLALTAFEDPHMIPKDHTPLQSWMLISLEPGVYVPDRCGARVENSFIVMPDGGVELRDALGVR